MYALTLDIRLGCTVPDGIIAWGTATDLITAFAHPYVAFITLRSEDEVPLLPLSELADDVVSAAYPHAVMMDSLPASRWCMRLCALNLGSDVPDADTLWDMAAPWMPMHDAMTGPSAEPDQRRGMNHAFAGSRSSGLQAAVTDGPCLIVIAPHAAYCAHPILDQCVPSSIDDGEWDVPWLVTVKPLPKSPLRVEQRDVRLAGAAVLHTETPLMTPAVYAWITDTERDNEQLPAYTPSSDQSSPNRTNHRLLQRPFYRPHRMIELIVPLHAEQKVQSDQQAQAPLLLSPHPVVSASMRQATVCAAALPYQQGCR